MPLLTHTVPEAYIASLEATGSTFAKYAKIFIIGCCVYFGVPAALGAFGYTLTFFYKKQYGIHFINATDSEVLVIINKPDAPLHKGKSFVFGPKEARVVNTSISFLGAFRQGFYDSMVADFFVRKGNFAVRRAVTPILGSTVPTANNRFWIRDNGIFLAGTTEIPVALWQELFPSIAWARFQTAPTVSETAPTVSETAPTVSETALTVAAAAASAVS